jgi:hypothetical protein
MTKTITKEILLEHIAPIFETEDFPNKINEKLGKHYRSFLELISEKKFKGFIIKSQHEETEISTVEYAAIDIVKESDFLDKRNYFFIFELINVLSDFYYDFHEIKICAQKNNENIKELRTIIIKLEKIRDTKKFLLSLHKEDFNSIIQTLKIQNQIEYTTSKSLLKILTRSLQQLLIKHFGISKNLIIAELYQVIFPDLNITYSSVSDHLRK